MEGVSPNQLILDCIKRNRMKVVEIARDFGLSDDIFRRRMRSGLFSQDQINMLTQKLNLTPKEIAFIWRREPPKGEDTSSNMMGKSLIHRRNLEDEDKDEIDILPLLQNIIESGCEKVTVQDFNFLHSLQKSFVTPISPSMIKEVIANRKRS